MTAIGWQALYSNITGWDNTASGFQALYANTVGGPGIEEAYHVVGEPTTADGARQLASEDKHQFQWWALGLVAARPVDEKKGADKGIDGRVFFHDETGGKTKQVILSVKGGHLKATDVRDPLRLRF